jgi:hypothetical protein
MIAIIEVPHRMPAALWTADDDADAVRRSSARWDNPHDLADADEVAAHDNHIGWALRTPADARSVWAHWRGHQAVRVRRLAAEAYAAMRGWGREEWSRACDRAAQLTDERDG